MLWDNRTGRGSGTNWSAFSRKGVGVRKVAAILNFISSPHLPRPIVSCRANLGAWFEKKGTVWDRYNLHFSSVIAWLVIYHVLLLTPFSINRLGLDRSGQFPGIEYDVMAHVMLVATGRWSWLGMMGSLCWRLRHFVSPLLLDVFLNQNPIIVNSTHFYTGVEIKKCDDS